MNGASLCSGIGGIDLAGEWVGIKTKVFCEREPFPKRVLRHHWPNVPIIDDIYEFTRHRLLEEGVITEDGSRTIDFISAGYPCQPFSHAGKREGEKDDRHIWPEVSRIIQEIRPRWFLGENVAGHITLGLDAVLSDLEGAGYTAQAFVIPASAVYASHQRERVFIVAYTECFERCQRPQYDIQRRWPGETEQTGMGGIESTMAHPSSTGLPQRGQPGFTESTTEAGAGMESELERCGKVLADSEINPSRRLSIGKGSEDTGFTCGGKDVAYTSSERCRKARGYRSVGPEKWSTSCGEAMADTSSAGWQERDSSSFPDRSGYGSGGSDEGRSHGPIESILGRSAHEFSVWMDGRGLNPLDALQQHISTYPQPALMGQPQYDWEPSRVASGVRNRTARLKALGNAVDPLQVLPILAAIKMLDDWMRRTA